MPSVVATTNADLKACLVRLRRIGDAASEIVERQDRTDIPAVGDVIEVAVAEATVPARVVQVRAAGAEQIITIEAISNDTGDSASDFITSDNTLTLAAGATLELDAGASVSDIQTLI